MQNKNLLNFAENITRNNYSVIEKDLGDGFYKLHISEADRRQAKHDIQWVEDILIELLRNSRDAGAKNILIATKMEHNNLNRHIIVIDDGCGIPANQFENIFLPRITNKIQSFSYDSYGFHGRGMALYSVKNNSMMSGVVNSEINRGTVISLSIDTNILPERKDQSTPPCVLTRNAKKTIVKGPKNINRYIVEFAIDRPDINFYYGSQTQISSTLFALARDLKLKNNNIDNRSLWQNIIKIGSATELKHELDHNFGLNISSRNCHRILIGDIKPLLPILSPVKIIGDYFNLYTDNKTINKIRIPRYVLSQFTKLLYESFKPIADKFNIEVSQNINTKVKDNSLLVSLNMRRRDD